MQQMIKDSDLKRLALHLVADQRASPYYRGEGDISGSSCGFCTMWRYFVPFRHIFTCYASKLRLLVMDNVLVVRRGAMLVCNAAHG